MEGDQLSFLGAEDIVGKPDQPRQLLGRTSKHSHAAVEFALEWESEAAKHTDILVASNLNLWRDYLPAEMEAALIDQPVGHVSRLQFDPGQLVPDYATNDCLQAPLEKFNRNYRNRGNLFPRAGRFYPRGVIAGVKGISSDDLQPFRIGSIEGEGMTVELNHPLAGKPVSLSSRILEAWAVPAEHGGRCNDVPDMIAGKGPGMQARWHGQPTDFFSDEAFARGATGADADFYTQARMVDHLDRLALRQVEKLYQNLMPRRGNILDLMSSWKSHLTGNFAHVSGLGMNAEELKANPILNERLVQDLNEQPRLGFDTDVFDGAVCTVSVEYLVRPFKVFAEINRVLKPGAPFVLAFSNRWFPPKVIHVWEQAHQFKRPGLVLEYFLQSGGWKDLHTFSLVGLPRPADDKYADRMAFSDPVHAVWGFKQ
ncbi:MAG: methyltransferase domain-containing protein [Thiobacillaceae bacterium]